MMSEEPAEILRECCRPWDLNDFLNDEEKSINYDYTLHITLIIIRFLIITIILTNYYPVYIYLLYCLM